MNYRREIDGLRSIAVVPVILYHAGLSLFSGGYVGVDIFFVISGYLITGILIEELAQGKFSILRFYERRARRILPALFTVILVCVPLAAALMTPPKFEAFSKSVLAVALFGSNMFFAWSQADYFVHEVELIPLLHTWSLAVEEQFYIVFPILLWVIWRFGLRRIFWVLVGLSVISLMLAQWMSTNAPLLNFYFAATRAWELLAGSLCAIVLRSGPRKNNGLSLLGLGMIAAAVLLYDSTVAFPSIYTLLPVVGTVLIILYAAPETLVGRLLSLPVMVGIGLVSYSAYLWHQPLLAFARLHHITEPPAATMAALVALTFILAWISWRFIEQPFRKTRHAGASLLPTHKSVFAASGAGIVALAAFGVYGALRDGLPNRFDTPDFVVAGQFSLPRSDNGYCFYSLSQLGGLEVGEDGLNCHLGETENPMRRGLLFGDSYAGHWEPFWDTVGQETATQIHAVTTNWCFPAFDDSFTGPRGSRSEQQCQINRAYLQENAHEYDFIMLAGEWEMVARQGYAGGPVALISDLLATSSADILIMAAPEPFLRGSVEQAVFFGDGEQLIEEEGRDTLNDELHAAFIALADAEPRVHFIDREMLFGDDIALSDEGLPYSLDGGHISIYGSLAAARHFIDHGGEDILRLTLEVGGAVDP